MSILGVRDGRPPTSKGGVGKSSLGRNLAAHWLAVGHKPALVDTDPQRGLISHYNPQGPMGTMPVVAEPEGLNHTIHELLNITIHTNC